MKCPKCGSRRMMYFQTKQNHYCLDCGYECERGYDEEFILIEKSAESVVVLECNT